MLEAMPVQRSVAEGRSIVRVLPQPLYDTEVITTSATTELRFFVKPLGQADQSAVITKKTLAETNLRGPGALPKPQLFDLFGFNLKIAANATTPITRADFELVLLGGYCEFTMGDRIYLRVPIADMPHGVAPEGFAATTANATTLQSVHNGVGHRSNIYKFTIANKYRAIIRWSESFGFNLYWPGASGGSINPSAALRCQAFLQGLLHNAL